MTPKELATAHYIITFGCDLGDLERPGMVIERWDDVPPPSQNLLGAWDRIRSHVAQLVMAMQDGDVRTPDATQGRDDDTKC